MKNLTFLLLFLSGSAFAETYQLTVENISNRQGFGGQTMTPFALLLHNASFEFFAEAKPSSPEVWLIAEDGDTGPALSLRQRDKRVLASYRGPRIFAGKTAQFSFDIDSRAQNLQFSLVSMLSRTNDGFTGLSNVNLPTSLNEKRQYQALAWDSGSEQNTESCEHVPCVNHRIRKTLGSEGRVIRHNGIQGIADLSPVKDAWPEDGVIAIITVERTK